MKKPVTRKNTTRYTLVCDICQKPVIQPGDTYYDWVGADICKTCFADIKPGEEAAAS